jgi:hypothetical protein
MLYLEIGISFVLGFAAGACAVVALARMKID